ncbi:Uma2 family endonuclease [Actinoallomurus spadix]|uniref:Uma2 family endonuclease n=1 Tax=Actinoallomurus spadix TaxID=79912 RepID=A0ABN0W8P9_9ACTN|nr:Uma2 family endonuclease [Actinoallomurus spadix]MCO5991402.1 Uma2 family endonuclease [Actinoallomurus spadix]
MSIVLEKPIDLGTDDRTDIERRYDELSERWPDRKVEVIDGRIVVREVPTTDHADIIFRLLLQLMPFVTERGWKIWQDVALFLGPQVDRYRPDLLVVPQDPPRWGDDHVFGNATHLVVEVVSKSSVRDDHEVKPRTCARWGVPLYLVIDGFGGKARLLSHPGQDGYAQEIDVKLGEPLPLPEPWDLTLDTGRLAG